MTLIDTTSAQAADTLRRWALDEAMKSTVLSNPTLARAAEQIARRYMAGSTAEDALRQLKINTGRGHLGSIELVGESIRDELTAQRESEAFVGLAQLLAKSGQTATISFDLSHVCAIHDAELGYVNAYRIAEAARKAGTHLMISAEGSNRTDLLLDLWERISADFPETGITLQARLHRTRTDLLRVARRPGPVRIVKGAFDESDLVAEPRNSHTMYSNYEYLVGELVQSGHRVNIATHDAMLVGRLKEQLGGSLNGEHVEFEMLQGLGTELLDSLHHQGFTTREYIVYGSQWWLYVLNRLAEHPARVITALADLSAAG